MTRLGAVRPIDPPKSESWKRREYQSPDGRVTLTFGEPDEFAMGATFWQTTLRGPGVRRSLPPAMGIGDPMAPFSFDGRFLAYQSVALGGDWPPPLSLFLAAANGTGVRTQRFESFISSVQWSPTQPFLLVAVDSEITILDERAEPVAVAASESERPIVGWLPKGEEFFVVADSGGGTSISYHRGTDGTLIEQEPLDPATIVPYDAEAYADLPRDHYSLEVNPGTTGVTSLLDRWNEARYDSREGELMLSVLRPTTPVDEAELKADAEVRWVAVPLNG